MGLFDKKNPEKEKKTVNVRMELPERVEINDYDTREALGFRTLLENGFQITGHLELQKKYGHELKPDTVYFIPDDFKMNVKTKKEKG